MKIETRVLKTTAALLSVALLHASFGPEAWAQVVRVSAVSAPMGAAAAAGAVGAKSASNAISAVAMTAAPLSPAAISAAPAAAAAPASVSAAASAPVAASDSSPLKSGPRTSGVAARASRVISGVRRFFSGRGDAGSVPTDAVAASNAGGAQDAPRSNGLSAAPKGVETSKVASSGGDVAPPSSDSAESNRRSIFAFLRGLVVAQVGVEVLGLTMPLLMQHKFGKASVVARMAVYASAAGIVGKLSGSWIAAHLGVKTTYIAATALRLVSITAMAAFLMGPAAPVVAAIHPLAVMAAYLGHFSTLHVLNGFYAFNGLMQGIAQTCEKSIPTLLLGNDRGTLEKFSSLQQWTLEIAGVGGPKVGGWLIAAFGYTTAIGVYPVMLGIAVTMYAFGIRMPKDGATGGNSGFFSTISQWLAPLNAAIGRLFRMIVSTSPFRLAATAATSAKDAVLWVARNGAEGLLAYAAAAPLPASVDAWVAGALDAVSSGGAKALTSYVLGSFVRGIDALVKKAYLGRWIDEMGGPGKLTDEGEKALLSRSTLGWIGAAVVSMAGFATLLLPTALPAYAAMIVFGVAQVTAGQKLYALMLSRTKKKDGAKVNAEAVKINAVAGAAFAVLTTVALNAAGALFDHAPGRAAFLGFTVALLPLAGAVMMIRRAIKRLDAEGAPDLAQRPEGGFALLAKDPVMRLAFAGFALLSVLNPMIYQMLSNNFGLLLMHGNDVAAGGIASSITAIYSAGGLLGALYMWRESSLISEAKQPVPASTESPAETAARRQAQAAARARRAVPIAAATAVLSAAAFFLGACALTGQFAAALALGGVAAPWAALLGAAVGARVLVLLNPGAPAAALNAMRPGAGVAKAIVASK